MHPEETKRLILDSHKLHYHPRAVADFLEGKEIFPLYAEISPTAYCNHRCLFCNFNYLGHKGKFPHGRILELIEELAGTTLKAVVFAGAGEPTLHEDTMDAIKLAANKGIDVAMSTNGALLNDKSIEIAVENLTWIRFSFSGGSPENYAIIHQTKESDYNLVLSNIEKMRALKDRTGSKLTIGTQFMLLPENKEFVISQAKIMKECGADYFVVKHFYESEMNKFNVNGSFKSFEYMESLRKAASELSDKNFSFIVREEFHLDRSRQYTSCYGLPFIVYFKENGDVYTCFFHQHDKNTSLGSILDRSFREIWNSEHKRRSVEYINRMIDKNKCQANCRHHQINNYLWELKHKKPAHVNFI